ncbi:hypothetical protein ACWDTP_01265 [Mycobacterium sp. NPDC003449]
MTRRMPRRPASHASHAWSTVTDVCAALGVDDGGGPGSAQLANLRAGLRSVPPLVRTTAKQAAPA